MVILDGKVVKEEEIDAVKHRFIGTFRHPNPVKAYEMVPERDRLHGLYSHQIRGEWMQGRFDVPQYMTWELIKGVS